MTRLSLFAASVALAFAAVALASATASAASTEPATEARPRYERAIALSASPTFPEALRRETLTALLLAQEAHLAQALAHDRHEAFRPLDSLRLRLDLDQAIARQELLGLGEGAVRQADLSSLGPEAEPIGTRGEPLGREQDARLVHLCDQITNGRHLLRIGRGAGLSGLVDAHVSHGSLSLLVGCRPTARYSLDVMAVMSCVVMTLIACLLRAGTLAVDPRGQ